MLAARASRVRGEWCDGYFLPWFSHVHDDDDAKVIVSADGTIENADDRKPH